MKNKSNRKQEKDFVPIEVEAVTDSLRDSEIIYANGFQRADVKLFFETPGADWVELFNKFQSELRLISVTTKLDFPADLARVVPFQVSDCFGVMGFSADTVDTVGSIIGNDLSTVRKNIFFEYLERKLIFTLNKTAKSEFFSDFFYLSSPQEFKTEVTGAIELTVLCNRQICKIYFGLERVLVNKIDAFWKNNFLPDLDEGLLKISSNTDLELSFDLVEKIITPEELIDLIKPDSIVETEVLKDSLNYVKVKLEGTYIADGILFNNDGSLFVKISKIAEKEERERGKNLESTISARIAKVVIPKSELKEILQINAIVNLETSTKNYGQLVFSGEEIAPIIFGTKEGKLCLKILPKS